MAGLKIGYLAARLSSNSGTDRYARSLAEAVSTHADVCVLTAVDAQNDTNLTNVVRALPQPNFNPLTQFRVAWCVLRYMRGCDAIHSLIEHYGPGLALAGFLMRVPVTMTLHGTYAVPPRRGIKHYMMRLMYASMPLTTSGSYNTAQKTSEVVPIGECRIIPNGVNLEKFHVIPNTSKEDLLLTVGALKARKGVDITLRAMALLVPSYPSLRYAVVGDDGHDSFSASTHQLVEDLGLSGQVDFYEGISDAKLRELYNRSKMFVLAARETSDGAFEGFPMVYYEANACGTPVITTTGFGSEYAIKDGENGFLVPPEDPEALSVAMGKLLGDEILCGSMATYAQQAAAAHTWDRIAELLMQFYNDVIAN